jgi:hypothetical protein
MVVAAAAIATMTQPAAGQGVNVRSAAHFERYTFDSLAYSAVAELTVPVSIHAQLGPWAALTVSGGLVRVNLEAGSPDVEDQTVSGALDTEARLAVNLVPGRLTLLASGAIPTGIRSVTVPELSLLEVVSRDIIGFAASDLGTGGYIGTGMVGAFPVGQMALGLAASYRYPFEYQPIQGMNNTLTPGGEIRVRAGLEGPLGRRTHLRTAGIVAIRQKDAINDSTVNGVGNRLIGYISLNQGIGAVSTVTVYAFDVFRSDPRMEQTAVGAAFLPRGNLFAAGSQLAFRLTARTELSPGVEYRLSHTAADTATTSLERTGHSWRFGLDLRQRISPHLAVVLNGSYLTGNVQRLAFTQTDVSLKGYRVAAFLEFGR